MTDTEQIVNPGAREPVVEDRRLGLLLLLVIYGFGFRLEDTVIDIPHGYFPIGLATVCFLLAAIRLWFVRTTLARSTFLIAMAVISVGLIDSAGRFVGKLGYFQGLLAGANGNALIDLSAAPRLRVRHFPESRFRDHVKQRRSNRCRIDAC